MLNDLLIYINRQIIVNEYEDDELMERSGYLYHEIVLESEKILLMKEGAVVYQIDWPPQATIRKDGSFPNFYIIEWDLKRVEIYFP